MYSNKEIILKIWGSYTMGIYKHFNVKESLIHSPYEIKIIII